MVDNVTADPGSGGAVFATDEVSSVHYPINKLAFGALDTVNLVESTTTNPFPVALSDTDNAVLDAMEVTLNAIQTAVEGTQTVSGTVTANLSATDNAVLDAIAASVAGTLTVDLGVNNDVTLATLPDTAASDLAAINTATAASQTALEIIDDAVAAEGAALGSGVLLQGDDGTDRKNINVDATTGDVQVDVTNTVTVDGSGVTQPVSGTVTANLSATDNAVLDAMEVTLNAIQAAVELLDNTVSGTELQVDIVSDGAGLLTTAAHDAAFGTAGAADAQVRTVQGIASMTPLLVDATGQGDVPVTLAGEAVSISGSVTVTGDVTNAGTFAVQEDGAALTALQLIDNIVLTEDSAHNTGDSGVMGLAVRKDDLATLAGTDGDYAPLQVDQDGALYVSEANRVDSNNSSTSTLGIGGVFTGTSTDALGFRNVSVAVYTDQNSATDGLQIQFSSDGTNWDHEEDYTVTGGTAEHHTVPVMGRYFRVVYTNGGTGQTAFRLESVLFADDITGSVSPIDSAVGVGNQAVLTKSVIAAENPSNTYVNIGATNGGNLKVSIEENSADVTIADGGNSITVDATSLPLPTGASTAANQSTANTALSAIQTAVELIDNAISGSEMQVDVVSSALPSGASTAANQSTIIGHVDGIEGLLSTIDADTGTIAGAVSGTEMQVDIVSGTVTANLGATDNAVLDSIDTNTTAATSFYRNIDANVEAAIKGSAGTLYWLHAMNMTASVAYLHLYDATTASVTPGTTTPTLTVPIPTQGDTNGAGFVLPLGANGQAFSTAITLVVTTTTDGSTGDPGTNGVFINAGYT